MERGASHIPPRRSPSHIGRARELRHGGNVAEATLWNELKAKKLRGHKFSRQVPLGPYYADFVCRQAKLVIELDGSQHVDNDYDTRRDEFMRANGYSVLRFWSADALKNIGAVCETILAVLDGRLTDDITSADLKFVLARVERPGGGEK
ncbi:endonuclease domain-containing protein [Mesorhizobium retamae]|uniref:DUF559 domain-containing protein n=1 Tax=Mesorhizobium retamae TaxID=2912854 RepID=A0ABS9QFR1_9HYPH|nr:DUF559 domain-containing protein [Mesorhizobium sp. IRAMC:0171]MCG7505469.1 DUF559 domain-containing protein [Mesorhizobium sp. IRAMC:0171]